MEIVIGGNRLGSGKKMRTHINNYERSTHDLSRVFTSTVAPGVLYPCFKELCTRGDNFDIIMDGDVRTIPTRGPLFGSYKLQVDFFQCPIRLYQALLHNNPLAIGMQMDKVKFPRLLVTDNWYSEEGTDYQLGETGKMADNCLLKYLGLSGIGRIKNSYESEQIGTVKRYINAIPALAYYEIFKNYYANKQEENAYVITGQNTKNVIIDGNQYITVVCYNFTEEGEVDEDPIEFGHSYTLKNNENEKWISIEIPYIDINGNPAGWGNIELQSLVLYQQTGHVIDVVEFPNGIQVDSNGTKAYKWYDTFKGIKEKSEGVNIIINNGAVNIFRLGNVELGTEQNWTYNNVPVYAIKPILRNLHEEAILKLEPFALSNIDDMKYDILSSHTLGQAFTIQPGTHDELPYQVLTRPEGVGTGRRGRNIYPMNGLVVKTYQNDMFNNWLNSEWVESENGINALTQIPVVDGKISIDVLQFKEKLYNMLNRVYMTDGTYESWEDAVYEEVNARSFETPMWIGGMSKEVVFDEVTQTAPAEFEGLENALGTLGGKGKALNESKQGGKLHIRVNQASYIIGIASLTPRQGYSQGNDFDLTDVFSMDDLHKPGMDQIGYEDLIGERMAWWDTQFEDDDANVYARSKIGKLPAWIQYMTSWNKIYGEFCDKNKAGYMVLNRDYEIDPTTHGIKDATTYIDPSKWNYMFAYTKLDAQNFWLQIGFKVTARRLMSARIIPNV